VGSYAQCWLDDLFVGSSKNDIDTEIISLFRPQDKIISASLTGSVPNHLKHYQETLSEEPTLKVVYYEAPVDVVRQRLNVLGYDLDTAKKAFSTWISEEHKRAQELAEEWGERDSDSKELMGEHYNKECEILSSLTPEDWIENLKVIQASGLKTSKHMDIHNLKTKVNLPCVAGS